jgi:ribonuclease R
MSEPTDTPALPTREAILEYIRTAQGPLNKRDLARAFAIKGPDRVWLKRLLKDLEDEGALERQEGRRIAPPASLPPVTVLEIVGLDTDGEMRAKPAHWQHEGAPPPLFVVQSSHNAPLAERSRILGKLTKQPDGSYEARVIRFLSEAPPRVIGRYEHGPTGYGRVLPADKKVRNDFLVAPEDQAGALPGEVVVCEVLPRSHRQQRLVRVLERVGAAGDPKAASLLAILEYGIPIDFPAAVREDVESCATPPLGDRADLRSIPLVTIDGQDARDFDDAVFAEPDGEAGGWHIIVAIADVAYYVRPETLLDKVAYERGNSVYFPDRVVPMLPERLSNDLCSLRPHEDRACLAVHMWIDGEGRMHKHRFVRGLMRSAARLVYEQAQAAIEGRLDETTTPLLESVIKPLYGAYAALKHARDRRGTLDLDLPERAVQLSPEGVVVNIGVRHRLDSHRLIEEFMICANVAAAEGLESKSVPCVYRVHDQPNEERLEGLRGMLDSLGYTLAKGKLRPSNFTLILDKVRDKPEQTLVNETILRSQAQAVYAPENIGHFGLALRRYAHFTSPIRRYADLLVHRGLIRAFGLGAGGFEGTFPNLEDASLHISQTERRAAAAERDAKDRYVAAFLADRVGARFPGRITSVTRFGLFVALLETGADGLVPISTLPDDFYIHDEVRNALIGQRWQRVYRLGAAVEVTLLEADRVTGGLLFRMENRDGADLPYAPLKGLEPPGGHRDRMNKRRIMTKARKVEGERKKARKPKR